jgi:hypothetical protein
MVDPKCNIFTGLSLKPLPIFTIHSTQCIVFGTEKFLGLLNEIKHSEVSWGGGGVPAGVDQVSAKILV